MHQNVLVGRDVVCDDKNIRERAKRAEVARAQAGVSTDLSLSRDVTDTLLRLRAAAHSRP